MNGKPGVLDVMKRDGSDAVMARAARYKAEYAIKLERESDEARATVERLAEALQAAVTRLDSIGCRASCAPHDDKEKASEAFTTIMRSAYAMRDDLREQLAAFRGDA